MFFWFTSTNFRKLGMVSIKIRMKEPFVMTNFGNLAQFMKLTNISRLRKFKFGVLQYCFFCSRTYQDTSHLKKLVLSLTLLTVMFYLLSCFYSRVLQLWSISGLGIDSCVQQVAQLRQYIVAGETLTVLIETAGLQLMSTQTKLMKKEKPCDTHTNTHTHRIMINWSFLLSIYYSQTYKSTLRMRSPE